MIPITKWAGSRLGYYVDRTWDGGKWVKGWAPIRLAPYHAAILEHIFTPHNGAYRYDTVCWAEPAKSGKSAIAGLVAQYAGLHIGQNSAIILASNKQSQAQSIMFRSLTDSVTHNPYLRIEPNRYELTFPTTGNTVSAIPSNSAGAAGQRFVLCCFDELWAYVYQDSERLWAEHKADPTRDLSLKFACGYAGYDQESALWQGLLEDGIKGDPIPELEHIQNEGGDPACFAKGRQFTFWSHVCRQGWQTPEWLDAQRASLRPAEYARMIECRFAQGIGNFCDPEVWAACIDPDHRPLEPGSPQAVHVGLDLAVSADGDDAALCGVYHEKGRVKLAFHKLWKGRDRSSKLQLGQTVKPYLLQLARDYRVQAVYADPWQAHLLLEELRNAGLICVEIPQNHASRGPRDTQLLELVNTGALCLYDHPEVRSAASGAVVKELGNGMIFLGKRSRLKIDLLVSLANCASEARYRRGWVLA